MEFTKHGSGMWEAEDSNKNTLAITELASIEAIGVTVTGEAFLLETEEDFDELIALLQDMRSSILNKEYKY